MTILLLVKFNGNVKDVKVNYELVVVVFLVVCRLSLLISRDYFHTDIYKTLHPKFV
jgi:hypothetical protein